MIVMADDALSFPRGFAAHVASLGLRGDGDDFAAVVAAHDVPCAAVYTRSRFAGASVRLSRERSAAGSCPGFVVVAKNANVATGPRGLRDAAEVCEIAGRSLGVDGDRLLVASTGVIGRYYPMPDFRAYFAADHRAELSATPVQVARAIMTTDTHPKVVERAVGSARVLGIAKGVGMLEPDMATMLAYVLTDAAVPAEVLDRIWRAAVDDTLNCLSVDTDTSTSDTAVVLASGAAGPVSEPELADAVRGVLLDLTLMLARDGEGATKLLVVTVTGARDAAQAKRVAKMVVNSPLVKTAVHGADPNWGRVAMAVGKCQDDADIDPDRVTISFGDLTLYPEVEGVEPDLDRLREIMSADEVTITVDLGLSPAAGPCRATVYGCDLSDGYVRINADYTT